MGHKRAACKPKNEQTRRHANTRGEWLATTITCSPRTHRSDRSVCFFKPSSENENANGPLEQCTKRENGWGRGRGGSGADAGFKTGI